ncbi:MAG: DGQHR domain-containing protein [Mesorhizobium sp.]|uniref:DGQHR domain-containing protein n=1 Tax=Mesorhizobium sp. TaxID=1871066 RepID=UPI000FE6DA87|nr:DGQHR domain-containing protein [Mesorhizobium sp.]RWN48986.1 MAG: DGQHR domain-containing protein [Mesorhizobium sp.]
MMKFDVLLGEVLGVEVARGFARLCDLSKISRADVFDEVNNPRGTQRDLSLAHAKDAYEYARNTEFGYWPEVFLCLRDQSCVRVEELSGTDHAVLHVNDELIADSDTIWISRVDGNHRLHLAGGETKTAPAIDRLVSFCLALSLTVDQEIKLFRDINNNQRRMDTSHLDKIELRLSGEDIVKARNPALFIASRLADDEDSPLAKFVYQGGKRPPGTFLPLRTLHTGIEYMLSRQTKLTALGGVDAQVVVIKNYFKALKLWVPQAWDNPKDYLLLRGAGFWGSCFLGADVIDRVLAGKQFQPEEMLAVLNSGRSWDWTRSGDFQGFSGRGGAVKIADTVIRELKDDQGISMKDLLSKILNI